MSFCGEYSSFTALINEKERFDFIREMERLEMTPEVAILLLIIFVSGFITIYFLFGNAKDEKGANWIGLYFLAFTLTMITGVFLLDDSNSSKYVRALSDILGNLEGLLLFLFIRKKTFDDFKLKGNDILICLPTFTVILIALFRLVDLDFVSADWYSKLNFGGQYLTRIFYGVLSLFYIKKYKSKTYQNYSNLDRHNANWMQFVVYSYLIYSIFPFLWGALLYFSNIDFVNQLSILAAGTVVLVYVCLILWKILQNAHLMLKITREENVVTSKVFNIIEKPRDKLSNRLHEFMMDNEPFLNPQITLKELAIKLNYSPRELSKIINEKLGVNFYDFINKYRIEYAKSLLVNPPDPKMTISEVYNNSGFNSKSSFNTAFKKHTGQTPTYFKSKALG